MSQRFYRKIVQWSPEDDCYVGTCPELFFGGVHGSNEAKVFRELAQEVKAWERILRRGKRTHYKKRTPAYAARR